MESVLAGFVRALRAAGAEASPAETIDAARALALTGYGDRATLKAVLGVVLAKSENDKRIHDDVFDLYFSLAAPPAWSADAGRPEMLRTGDERIDALLELAAAGGTDGSAADALRLALTSAASNLNVDDIRFDTQITYLTHQILQAMGIAPLEARLTQRMAEPEGEGASTEIRVLTQARETLTRHARALVQQRFELFGKPATEAFMTEVAVTRSLGRMASTEMERLKTAVNRMARRLASRHSRRQRVELRGQLDLRRTMRANAGHDGVPITLAFKHRRRDKPRIVAVCDVSGSVAANVRFLLLFLYALHDVVGDLRSFAFSNRLQDVSARLERLPFDEAMAVILKEVGSGSTDYGQAWVDLSGSHADAVDRHTTIIVLGDGRTNGTDPRLDLFAQLADRAKRLVWLCPEPERRWGSGDSAILRYRPFCSSLSYCATAIDVERALDEALAAYR